MRRFASGPRPALVALTGAGISAPSGLPTFRDPGETQWRDPAAERFMHASTYGSHLPQLWAWSESIRTAAAAASPNAAHEALARVGAGVITTNVDGLHARAGSDAVEMHGTCSKGRCRCGFTFDVLDGTVTAETPVPVCPRCRWTRTRPDVLLFGEVPRRADRDRVDRLLANARVLVVVGSSGTVWPAAGYPEMVRSHARTVLVNAEPWAGDVFDEVVLGDAAELTPCVLAGVLGEQV